MYGSQELSCHTYHHYISLCIVHSQVPLIRGTIFSAMIEDFFHAFLFYFSSSAQIRLSRLKYRHTQIPAKAITRKRNAAPEPLPLPNILVKILPAGCIAIIGSNTSSTRNPPRKYPIGMVKNCREFLTEYTLPCICSGTRSLMMASRFVLISGMAIHPRNPPIHQIRGVCPNARRKFSVLMEKSRQLHITRTLLFGFFTNDARILPAKVVSPITAFTIPRVFSLPPILENIIYGNAASYTDATRLIAAKNIIRPKIPCS